MKNILFYGGASLLSNIWSNYWRDRFNLYLALNRKWVEIEGTTSIQLSHNLNNLDIILKNHKIDLVINCTGFTNVEECEINKDLAYYLNGYLPGKIAKITSDLKIKLIHISTDHLFDGKKIKYSENDNLNPLNTYGKSKALGEQEVIKNDKNALIIRTNFFGNGPSYKPSFSDAIASYLILDKKIELFSDVYYTPIHVNQLADNVLNLLKIDANGIFNISSNERITKYDFGLMIAKKMNKNQNLVIPIEIEKKTNLIVRPKDMSLLNNKIKMLTKVDIEPLINQINYL